MNLSDCDNGIFALSLISTGAPAFDGRDSMTLLPETASGLNSPSYEPRGCALI